MEQLIYIMLLIDRYVARAMPATNKNLLAYRYIWFFGASGETPAAKLSNHLE